MAVFTGNNGVINIDSNPVAQVSSWTLETTSEAVEHSVIGSNWREFAAGIQGFNLQIEGYYDIADTGAAAIVPGASVTFELYPAGNTSGERQYDGSAIVSGVSDAATFDGMVTFSGQLQGTGALTTSTVTP